MNRKMMQMIKIIKMIKWGIQMVKQIFLNKRKKNTQDQKQISIFKSIKKLINNTKKHQIPNLSQFHCLKNMKTICQ